MVKDSTPELRWHVGFPFPEVYQEIDHSPMLTEGGKSHKRELTQGG